MKKNMKHVSLWILTLAMAVTLSGCNANLSLRSKNLKPEEAKSKVEKFINDNLMAPGSKAKIENVTEENGLYKVVVNIGQEQNIDSYMTKDGTKFFPQALDIKEVEGANASSTPSTDSATGNQPAQEVKKNDKPVVELFVMSHCPYGTQIEKGILPVVKALGSKIDFKLKFCDYAMHGEKELTEQLNQYCINKEQTAKYVTYLECFLKAGDSAACMTTAKIDSAKLKTCVAKTDKDFSVMSNFKDKKEYKGSFPSFNVFKDDNAKYNVGGSPTLVINGAEISSGRDSAGLLKTICSAFNKSPKECEAKLSSETPAPGFGTGSASNSGAAADCATN